MGPRPLLAGLGPIEDHVSHWQSWQQQDQERKIILTHIGANKFWNQKQNRQYWKVKHGPIIREIGAEQLEDGRQNVNLCLGNHVLGQYGCRWVRSYMLHPRI